MILKNTYHVLGVMSGTSLDGIDIAEIHFNIIDKKWNFAILNSQTIAYNNQWLTLLKEAHNYNNDQLIDLNIKYSNFLGEIIKSFINKHSIKNIDAVCSHGHTILHQPQNGFTLQIGSDKKIAQICENLVVCDFRTQDVQLGGQGAPLVPIGDEILFSDYDYCLNLGGFSNISYKQNDNRIAYDISPVNTVLNYYVQQLGFDYDDQGKIASTGIINTTLLNELNEVSFYNETPPKSLGIEFVNDIIYQIINKYNIPIKDILRTFVEHIALQITKTLTNKYGKLLVTGGGAYHSFLIERLINLNPNISITIPENEIIEFKEALIFALLGVLKLRGEINTLSSVTGASVDHSAGIIIYPN